MRTTLPALALLLVTLCGLGLMAGADLPSGSPAPAPVGRNKLWAAISVNKPVLDREALSLDTFTMYFALFNDGDEVIAPKLGQARLYINGEEYKDELAGFNFMSGPHDERSELLPPGDYVSFSKGMGELFKNPGVYHVYWKGRNFRSPEVVFRVVSRKK